MENYTNFVIADTSLRCKLRTLMTQYTAKDIHESLQTIFHEDYAFFQSLYEVRVNNLMPPVLAPVVSPTITTPVSLAPPVNPQQTQVPEQTEAPISNTTKLRPDTKIRIVKRPIAEAEAQEESVVIPNDEEVSSDRGKKAQLKREQTDKEATKFKELQAKGIDPETLLTKDNLKKWIEMENLTYAQIARDHVGLSAMQVSTTAKAFGFKSMISKKRAIILASVAKGQKH